MRGSCTKHVFHAFSAYVSQVTGRTTCLFWPDDPNDRSIDWDPNKAFSVDLTKTPSAARDGRISWDEVQVDDHAVNGGLTTIGPLFPGGGMIGGVWLHKEYMDRIELAESAKPRDMYPHELRFVMYAGDRAFGDRRFHGFHAEVVGPPVVAAGSQVTRLKVWNGGQGMSGGPASMWWIDLADAADMTESSVGVDGARAGSLYLDADKRHLVMAGGGIGPKLPKSLGH